MSLLRGSSYCFSNTFFVVCISPIHCCVPWMWKCGIYAAEWGCDAIHVVFAEIPRSHYAFISYMESHPSNHCFSVTAVTILTLWICKYLFPCDISGT